MAAADRLRHTVGAMLNLTFGDEAAQQRALTGIRAIHERVNGRLERAVGPFPAGTPYSANDPDLLLWVHATLLESVVTAHDAFIGPVEAIARDAYCEESAPIAVSLGARPDDVPRTWTGLLDYLASVTRSGVLVVSDDARAVANAVLSPPMSAAIWPVAWLNRQFTIATLPERIRQEYGFTVSTTDTARVDRAARLVRRLRTVTPKRLAHWRAARVGA